jgi:hypothetical protein
MCGNYTSAWPLRLHRHVMGRPLPQPVQFLRMTLVGYTLGSRFDPSRWYSQENKACGSISKTRTISLLNAAAVLNMLQ